MKRILFVILLFISFCSFGQDKMVISADSLITSADTMIVINALDYDYLAYKARVIKAGGVIINEAYCDSTIKMLKTYNLWNSTISYFSANMGVKFTVSGNDSLVDILFDLKGRYDMIGTTTTRPDLQKNVKNGKYSIYFDTTGSAGTENNFLISTTNSNFRYAQPITYLLFYKTQPSPYTASFRIIYATNTSGSPQFYKTSVLNEWADNCGSDVKFTQLNYNNKWQLHTFVYNGATSKRLLDGGSITTGLNSGTTSALNNIKLGYNSSTTGLNNYFTELLIMQGDQATNAKNYIHPFLNQRYNIY